MTRPTTQGDGAAFPFDDQPSAVGVAPGWEWLRSLARPRQYLGTELTHQPWTLFGEVQGTLTVVTNGWFLLALKADVGYPVADAIHASRLRSVLRSLPLSPVAIFELAQLRAFLGLPADAAAPCDRCHRRHRINCPECARNREMEFAPPCYACNGRGHVPCPACVVDTEPMMDPVRIGTGVFNRAIAAPVIRRLSAGYVSWRQADAHSPAVIRADAWTLVLMPLRWDDPARIPSFRAVEVAA